MKNRTYRPADERDVDNKKLVYVTDAPNFIFEFDGSFCAHSKRVIEKIEIDEKTNSVIYHTKNPHEKYPEKWRYAFVEVTLADFNTQDIIYYLRDKGYTVWNESATKEERDLSYRAGYDAGKLSNKNYREVYGRGYGAGKRDAHSRTFKIGAICSPKEKTLADFNDGQLLEAVRARALTHDDRKYRAGYEAGKKEYKDKIPLEMRFTKELLDELDRREVLHITNEGIKEGAFKEGYEAGKRDAAPKWVSVKERFPSPDAPVLVYGFDSSYVFDYRIDSIGAPLFNWNPENTHWMPLPAPPEDAQEEKPSITGTLSIANGFYGRLLSLHWGVLPP